MLASRAVNFEDETRPQFYEISEIAVATEDITGRDRRATHHARNRRRRQGKQISTFGFYFCIILLIIAFLLH